MQNEELMKQNEELMKRMKKLTDVTKGATLDDLQELIKVFLDVIKELKNHIEKNMSGNKDEMKSHMKEMYSEMERMNTMCMNMMEEMKKEGKKEMEMMSQKMMEEMNNLESMIPEMPEMPDIDALENKITKRIDNIVIPKLEDIDKILPKFGESIRDGLELLEGDSRIDKSAIKGLDELENKLKTTNFGSGGGMSGINLYVGGTKVGAVKGINMAAGTGATVSHSTVNGLDTFTFNSTATTAGYQAPTGTVDGGSNPTPNKTFTFTVAPNVIVSDGVTLRETQSDGNSNWTGTTTVVMTVAPTYEIYGVA